MARKFSDRVAAIKERRPDVAEAMKLISWVKFELKSLREGKRLSQTDLAKRTGWKQPYISKLETGDQEVLISTISKYVEACEGSVALVIQGSSLKGDPIRTALPLGSDSDATAKLLCDLERAGFIVTANDKGSYCSAGRQVA